MWGWGHRTILLNWLHDKLAALRGLLSELICSGASVFSQAQYQFLTTSSIKCGGFNWRRQPPCKTNKGLNQFQVDFQTGDHAGDSRLSVDTRWCAGDRSIPHNLNYKNWFVMTHKSKFFPEDQNGASNHWIRWPKEQQVLGRSSRLQWIAESLCYLSHQG